MLKEIKQFFAKEARARAIESRIKSSVYVKATIDVIWRNVTEVDISNFRHPWYLALLDIPKPLSAEVIKGDVGGARIAYFENGKKFSQFITKWEPMRHYGFTFSPDPDFRVCFFFDISSGVFQMISGAYELNEKEQFVELSLTSNYRLRPPWEWLNIPVRTVLTLFQKYLLSSIASNSEKS